MLICQICGFISNKLKSSFSTHLRMKHNLSTLEYFIKYENFVIPKCECGKDRMVLGINRIRKTCGDRACQARYMSDVLQVSMKNDKTREKLKNKRLEYLKNNPDKTAWRLGNKQSWPEKFFEDACIRAGLDKQYLIIKEKSEFPYYIDFAFPQIRLAVEIDGSQHKLSDRKNSDNKKDKHLIEHGWRIFRIPANKLYSKDDADVVILSLIDFKNDMAMYVVCGIMTHKEIKKNIKNENRRLKVKKKEEIEHSLRDLDFSNRKWTKHAASILNIKSTSVRRFIAREFPTLFKTILLKAKGTHKISKIIHV